MPKLRLWGGANGTVQSVLEVFESGTETKTVFELGFGGLEGMFESA